VQPVVRVPVQVGDRQGGELAAAQRPGEPGQQGQAVAGRGEPGRPGAEVHPGEQGADVVEEQRAHPPGWVGPGASDAGQNGAHGGVAGRGRVPGVAVRGGDPGQPPRQGGRLIGHGAGLGADGLQVGQIQPDRAHVGRQGRASGVGAPAGEVLPIAGVGGAGARGAGCGRMRVRAGGQRGQGRRPLLPHRDRARPGAPELGRRQLGCIRLGPVPRRRDGVGRLLHQASPPPSTRLEGVPELHARALRPALCQITEHCHECSSIGRKRPRDARGVSSAPSPRGSRM